MSEFTRICTLWPEIGILYMKYLLIQKYTQQYVHPTIHLFRSLDFNQHMFSKFYSHLLNIHFIGFFFFFIFYGTIPVSYLFCLSVRSKILTKHILGEFKYESEGLSASFQSFKGTEHVFLADSFSSRSGVMTY